jgi:GntR family transcriptional regulator
MEYIINHDSKVPLYYQLKEQIRKDILNGGYQEGDLIPSERELSDRYDLSSTTIRRALNDLVQENFLERKAGKGTFVRLKKVKANAYARSKLDLEKESEIVRLKRAPMCF